MIEAKTLRALAKHSGYKPATIFRMQPKEILELLTEKFDDIKNWDEGKAQETINKLLSDASAQKKAAAAPSEEGKPPEEPKKAAKAPAKKRTRRTKAQIAADEAAKAKANTPDTEVAGPDPEQSVITRPRRQRKKKSPVAASSVGGVSSEEIAVLKETVLTLQAELGRLTVALDDVTMFLTWFHNVKIDPKEPIAHLAEIDWQSCIDDQVK